jgi:WD40 repeat protein
VTAGGKRLASLAPGTSLRVFDVATAEPALELHEAEALRAFAASPDGRWFAGSVASPEEEKPSKQPPLAKLAIWDATTGRVAARLEGQAGPVTAFAFSPDSAVLASAGFQSTDVWLWDVPSGQPRLLIPGAAEGCSVEALAFQPAGRLLAVAGIDYLSTAGSDGRVVVWDLVDRRPVREFEGGAGAIAFHPDGRLLAAAALNRTVRIVDVTTGGTKAELSGHHDTVTAVAYSPDGRLLASASDDRTVRVWDAATGARLGCLELDTQVKALAFGPDSRTLYTGNANASCYEVDVAALVDGD